MSRLLIMTYLEENMRASMTFIPIWMSRGHFSDMEYDSYELDQQTPGVKQSKQFYYREGKISQPC